LGFGIASIIVIDEDIKARREVLFYLKELHFEDVDEFETSSEFELSYFQSLLVKNTDGATPVNPLSHAPEELVKFLSTATFVNTPAFAGDTLEITTSIETTQITKISSTKLFNQASSEIVSKNTLLTSLLADISQEEFKKFQAAMTKTSLDTSHLILFKNEKNEIWLLEMTGRNDSKNLIFTAKDKTREIGLMLGKDMGKEEVKKVEIKPVLLVLFRYTSLKAIDTKAWVTRTSALLKKVGRWPEGGRPKFIAIRYDEDPKEKAEFNHPFIDDLICQPFDRLIFLQKIEITLALPKKASPTHLFVQAASDAIEISKKAKIERVSDLGIATANPIPLTPGTVGHFYFKFSGQKNLLDVYGKVFSSIPHPERPGESLVYFNFFGLNRNMNKEFKNYLTRDTGYKNLVDNDPKNFAYNPDNIFLTDEQKRRKTIVVLDVDENVLKNAGEYLKTDIGNVDVVTEDTYYGFFKRYLEANINADKAPPVKAEDFYAESVSVIVNMGDSSLQMPLQPPTETDLFIGHEAQKMFNDKLGWLKLFEGNWKDLLNECLHLLQITKRIYKNFELKSAAGDLKTVAIEFILEENKQSARINFKVPDMKIQRKPNQLAKLESLECIMIDYSMLPDDIDRFINNLKEAAEKLKLRMPAGGPKLIVTAAENQKVDFDKLLKVNVYAFMYKPLEIRRTLYFATQALESPYSLYLFDNISWKIDNISAKIARPARLTEMSEFGATIKTEQPLKPGTMLYLFNSIFTNAPDSNLCVRVYFSEEDSEEPGTYINSVVYFGITDAFLKFTRAYIRETYATNKTKPTGGT
jgi:hypothetical protein